MRRRNTRSRGTTMPGRIRIIAGSLRNSKLEVRDAAGLRPTPERVRETLFNWLAPAIDGARCLDAYAGTGALGIEAASRGAGEVVLVERDATLAREIAANLARLRIANARVEQRDVVAWLATAPAEAGPSTGDQDLARARRAFDIVFVDPPFDAGLWSDTCRALECNGWLAPGALVYLEWPSGATPEVPPGWREHRSAKAGDVHYALYRCSPAAAALAGASRDG
ncbi:MAG TPA: 16S rRNA (guanine(966)-N(2))-methyltransferase RsmD [Candidatus Saccharimonadia bacterium]|nr:16S rRNA (guanine(966)-N(2))-methyltransferase RsmD [Candidatus Saccharimonadia bacterium]